MVNALAPHDSEPGKIPAIDTRDGLWSPDRTVGFSPDVLRFLPYSKTTETPRSVPERGIFDQLPYPVHVVFHQSLDK